MGNYVLYIIIVLIVQVAPLGAEVSGNAVVGGTWLHSASVAS